MIIESIVTTITELNTGSNVIKTIEIPTITKAQTGLPSDVTYRTVGIKVLNSTGAAVDFIPMTAKEYLIYVDDTTFSDYIPIASDGIEVLDNLRGVIQTLVIKGAGSGHTSDLEIIVYKELNY